MTNALQRYQTILVADDLQKWRDSVKRNLAYYQAATPLEATTANEAVRLAETHRPDLAILDINYDPENPGLEGDLSGLTIACQGIRERFPDSKIVVMSANQPEEVYRELARQYGADYFINKERLVEGFKEIAGGSLER